MVGVTAWAAVQPEVVDASGRPVHWAEWLDEHGPAAVVVSASWAPGAEDVLEHLPALRQACAERGLSLVVVGVQEPLQATKSALEGREVTWFGDRRGSLLKAYHLIRVPVMVILERSGAVLARVDASPEGLADWQR